MLGNCRRRASGEERTAEALEARMRALVRDGHAGAISVAALAGGEVLFARTVGSVDREGAAPADERTVFRAASLSKPVFAYLAMRLVDRGLLDLDRPLHEQLGRDLSTLAPYASLKDDARRLRLTPRLLLSHQGGLPNWRAERPDGPLPFLAEPGERFSYSGEGYLLLQKVVEELSDGALPDLARAEVFEPLGMRDSSFLWEERFDGRFAVDLASPLAGLLRETRTRANAAATLVTNARDYALFLRAVVSGGDLAPATRAAMLEPTVALTSRSLFAPPGTDGGANRDHALAWTPGWGTFRDARGRALFHVGAEEGCENFALVFPERGAGVAILSRRDGEGSISDGLAREAVGSGFSPVTWLEYGPPVAEARGPAPSRLLLAALGALAGLALAVALRAALSSRRAPKGGALPGLVLLAVLAASGCGTRVHEHAVEIVVRDASGRLGAPPHEVGVFDWRMGRSAEWARRTAGTAGAGPYRTTFSTVDTVTVGVARPEKIDLALWLPGLEPEGFYALKVEPKARPEGRATLRPARFDEAPVGADAPALAVRWTATPVEKGWRLALELGVPAAGETGSDG